MMMSSPEPMTLGSPTQSPSSNNNVNQYLPQFLLGDLPSNQNNQLLNSRSNQSQYGQQKLWSTTSNNTNSPPRNHQFGSSLFNQHHQNLGSSSLSRSYSLNAYDVKINNSNLIEKSESNYGSHFNYNNSPHHDRTLGSTSILGSNLASNQTQNIPGAPPVNRLADIINKPAFSLNNPSTNNLLLNTPNDSRTSRIMSDYYSEHKNNQDLPFTPTSNHINPHRLSPPSPTQIDPFYTHGEQIKVDEKLDDTWITVFGFPQSATSYVLQEFSVYGQILRHCSTQGNWLHIQYQTKLQAQKALSKNGKVLANNLMVGVMKCIDKNVMNVHQTAAENEPQKEQAQQKVPKPFLGSGVKLDRTQSLRTGIRPLGQLNRNLESSSSATTDSIQSSKLPKKNTNVISKAMEYMFGW